MKRSIVLNKAISCEYICSIIQELLTKESNIDHNKVLTIDLISINDIETKPIGIEYKDKLE